MAIKKMTSMFSTVGETSENTSGGLAAKLAKQVEDIRSEVLEEIQEAVETTIEEIKEKIEDDCEEAADEGERILDIEYDTCDMDCEFDADKAFENYPEQVIKAVKEWCVAEGFKNVKVEYEDTLHVYLEW